MGGDQFTQVNGFHLSFQSRHLDAVFDVGQAERACGHDHAGAGFLRHLDPADAHPFVFLRFIEEHQTAAAAAEGPIPGLEHFHPADAGNGIEHLARGIVDVIVTAEITGVVIRIYLVRFFLGHAGQLDGSGSDLSGDELADMLHRRKIRCTRFSVH